MKLHSKSYKQIYIEWIHEKSLRNKKLLDLEKHYMHRLACIMCRIPLYPLRPASKYKFQSIGGFDQHPNSMQEM
jgi:hypothetical protein